MLTGIVIIEILPIIAADFFKIQQV